MRVGTMLKNINILPDAESQFPIDQGNADLGLGEGGADVGGHVVGTLRGMAVIGIILPHQAAEIIIQIVQHIRVGVLLNDQRRRRVGNKYRQQSGVQPLAADPGGYFPVDVVQTFAMGGGGEGMGFLSHR